MSNDVSFDRNEIGKLQEIISEQRNALVRRIQEAFPNYPAEALGLALAMLFSTAFVDDDVEQQHDVAVGTNQVLARASHATIAWRVTPVAE
jgi:hypothetical protein